MTKIVFGLDLDGYEQLTPRNTFGELICGPRRLIDVLEVRLGLAQKSLSPASRIAKYRELLEKASAARRRFYSDSFAKDGFAVAETLLGWRDELILAGWDELSEPTRQRLRDLGDVERMGVPGLLPGFGDRTRAVLAEFDYHEPKVRPINEVDNPDDLPCLLREVLLRLGASFGYVYDDRVASSSAPLGSDLRKIQDALRKAGEKRPISLKYDGSVLFVTAYSEITLARFAGHLIQNNRRENQLTTVVLIVREHKNEYVVLGENGVPDVTAPERTSETNSTKAACLRHFLPTQKPEPARRTPWHASVCRQRCA